MMSKITKVDPSIHEFYKAFGQRHWYLRGRYAIADYLLAQLPMPDSAKVIDVGCGGGEFLELLSLRTQIEPWGSDLSCDALKYATKKFKKLLCADTCSLPIRSTVFDIVIAIDTFEHIPDDLQAVRECYRILKNGGYLFMTVPAFQCLWGYHDELYGHQRRYRLKQIKTLLHQAGFTLRLISYMQCPLFIAMYFFRKIKNLQKSNKDDFFYTNRILDSLLKNIIEAEKYILGKMPIPFGTNIVAIAQKI